MRDIKFRGKNAKGEWIYGDLLRNRGETFIAPEGIANPLATADDFRVDPETVGQFTGLFDKNRKEIYEGDEINGCDIVGYDLGGFWAGVNSLYRLLLVLPVVVTDNIHDKQMMLTRDRGGC